MGIEKTVEIPYLNKLISLKNMPTERQQEVLDFIKKYRSLYGYAPSYREIAKGIGVSSPASVWEHIKRLEEQDYIRKADEPRSIEVVSEEERNEKEQRLSLPLLGEVAAGAPIRVYEDEESFVIPKNMVSPEKDDNFFALEVRGESMIEEGIMDGDHIICEPAEKAENGDVVVALVEKDEVTLKKFYKERNFIRLMPANSDMEPILSRDVEVQAVVRAVVRKY